MDEMTDNIDPRDRQLLALLQRDCRLSNAELAERAGLSASACWRRIRALEEAGVIERYAAIVRPARLGLAFHAIVHVQLIRHDPKGLQDFIRAVSARPEVQECYATTGQADYHLRVLCRDIEAYNRFLEEFLFTQPAVRSAQTNVVLREVKRSAEVGV
jgi:Lrp/AsnC family leucine-responsive transcriptional regulator